MCPDVLWLHCRCGVSCCCPDLQGPSSAVKRQSVPPWGSPSAARSVFKRWVRKQSNKHGYAWDVLFVSWKSCDCKNGFPHLTVNIPSLARQRCLPSWGPRRTPWFFFVISQLFDAVDYSNYAFWVSETIIQWFRHCQHQIFYVYLFQQK